jgi:hypothetical protein
LPNIYGASLNFNDPWTLLHDASNRSRCKVGYDQQGATKLVAAGSNPCVGLEAADAHPALLLVTLVYVFIGNKWNP